jgi:hypothetical protein
MGNAEVKLFFLGMLIGWLCEFLLRKDWRE